MEMLAANHTQNQLQGVAMAFGVGHGLDAALLHGAQCAVGG